MTDSWSVWEGASIAGRYRLEKLLGEDRGGAHFLTRLDDTGERPAVIRIAPLDSDAGAEWLRRWEAATQLSHPNLVQVWEAGRSEGHDSAVAYALTEYPEENLAGVVRERPLTGDEAREVLRAAVSALAYLHAKGLVHGEIAPGNVVAVGDRIKLTSDNLQIREGAAEDIRALGGLLYEILTQRRDPEGEDLDSVPPPFRDIIRGCLQGQWTLSRIAAALDGESAVPEAPAEAQPAAQNRGLRGLAWAGYVLGAVAVALLVGWLFRTPRREPQAATYPPSAARGTKQPEPSPAAPEAPRSRPEKASPSEARSWRVIVYTYEGLEYAAKEVARINRRWPQLEARIFSPHGSRPPHFVALGGRMTHAQALRLRRAAVSKGLPRDTFVRSFAP